MSETASGQNKTTNRFKLINKYFVVPFYRLNILPFFFVGKIIALVYTKGRKSGKTRITPLEYRKYEGNILLFSARGKFSDWYKNIVAYPDNCKIKVGFRKHRTTIYFSTLDDKKKILKWYMEKYPKSAKELFGYKKGELVSDEAVFQLATFLEILQLKIQ